MGTGTDGGAGVGLCVVVECGVGDVGGVVAVVAGMLFSSPGTTCPLASQLSAGSHETTAITGSSDNAGQGLTLPSRVGDVTPVQRHRWPRWSRFIAWRAGMTPTVGVMV